MSDSNGTSDEKVIYHGSVTMLHHAEFDVRLIPVDDDLEELLGTILMLEVAEEDKAWVDVDAHFSIIANIKTEKLRVKFSHEVWTQEELDKAQEMAKELYSKMRMD